MKAKKTFREIWRVLDKKGKQDLCRKIGTSYPFLSMVANGKKKPGPDLVGRITKETGAAVHYRTTTKVKAVLVNDYGTAEET